MVVDVGRVLLLTQLVPNLRAAEKKLKSQLDQSEQDAEKVEGFVLYPSAVVFGIFVAAPPMRWCCQLNHKLPTGQIMAL